MNYTNRYIKRTQIAGKILRFAPFARAVLLNGSMVTGEDSLNSDIDFLIITQHGRIYTARFFSTFLVGLTGYRRHGKKVAGRICLNCYLSDQKLDISPHDQKSNLKVAKAYKYAIPLVDNGICKKFFKVNKWFKNKLKVKNNKSKITSEFIKEKMFAGFPKKPIRKFERFLSGKFGDYLERKLMKYQQIRILKGKKRGDEIFADKFEIRLHPRKSSAT